MDVAKAADVSVATVSRALNEPEKAGAKTLLRVQAAQSLGASFTQIFLGIFLPAILPAIVAASLMVFALSLGEFNLTWMLHTPLTRTLTVGLWQDDTATTHRRTGDTGRRQPYLID